LDKVKEDIFLDEASASLDSNKLVEKGVRRIMEKDSPDSFLNRCYGDQQ
jgi:hypothetical protein